MLRALIEDRFKMKDHWEDRPVTAYTLKAVSPKLTKGDPKARTRCDEGPGPNGKDLRLGNPMINRLVFCQNVTLEQLGILLPNLAFGYIYYPVADGTGLLGSYDVTLAFSSVDRTPAPCRREPTTSRPRGHRRQIRAAWCRCSTRSRMSWD